jgi:hypothetical protein
MSRIAVSVLILIAAGCAAPAPGKPAADRVPVFLFGDARDDNPVGRQLLLELRQAVRGASAGSILESDLYRLVEDEKSLPHLRVEVSTLAAGSGAAVAYGIAYAGEEVRRNGIFLYSALHLCPGTSIPECVQVAVDLIGLSLENLRRNNPDLARNLK